MRAERPGSVPRPGGRGRPRTPTEGLFGSLRKRWNRSFHKGRAPSQQCEFAAAYLRSQPGSADLRLLRGVLADTQRMARLAQDGSADGKIG